MQVKSLRAKAPIMTLQARVGETFASASFLRGRRFIPRRARSGIAPTARMNDRSQRTQ
jgi:hypothetical protein